jgi:hypothetical protein
MEPLSLAMLTCKMMKTVRMVRMVRMVRIVRIVRRVEGSEDGWGDDSYTPRPTVEEELAFEEQSGND